MSERTERLQVEAELLEEVETRAVHVAEAAKELEVCRADLDSAIRTARAAGIPNRTIADEAGLSYETVRQISLKGER